MTSSDSTASAPKSFLPPRWIVTSAWAIHRSIYRWSKGRFGLSEVRPGKYGVAQLTTTGRRSGEARSVMIGYFKDNGTIVTMAMNGWAEAEPAWWLNLQANPNATLTMKNEVVNVVGSAATGSERERLWERWRHLDKQLDGWAARRPSETAVVILTPKHS